MITKRIVIARIFGGLGNQLFIYAAARSLALKTNSQLYLDVCTGFVNDKRYKRSNELDHFKFYNDFHLKFITSPWLGFLVRNLLKVLNFFSPKGNFYLKQEGMDFNEPFLLTKVSSVIYLEGYWQSQKYFEDVIDTIAKDLEFNFEPNATIIDLLKQIKSTKSVGIHLRFFQDPSNDSVNNLDKNYYVKAIKELYEKDSNQTFFVFSDNIPAAKLALKEFDFNFFYIEDRKESNSLGDFWLYTHCNDFIISNSTFSWWGAWLSKNKNKKVICPKISISQGEAFWGFKGLLPEEWIKL